MKCHQTKDILNLYRECGGEWDPLLSFRCSGNYNESYNPRILLDLSSRCWTLPDAVKSDYCVYTLRYTNPKIPEIATDVRVLDRVLSFNTTTNSSRLGLDMAVSVRFSAGAVTWKVDGDSLQLIDDNRTLIIHNVQRDDAERRFQVWITNPVSEEILDCQLNIRDPVIISNITCNISWLGEDMALYLPQTSGHNAATWEVDGVPSDGYQLMEGDRMLIIPRNNTERSIWAGVTIPVGNEKWKYWLENRENDQNGGNEGSVVGSVAGSTVGIVVGTIVGIGVFALVTVVVIICIKHQNRSRNQIPGWVRACYHRA